jgi:hypothetical protein
MKSFRPLPLAALLIAVVAAGVAWAKPAANDKLDDIYTVIYSLADLPVYRLTEGAPEFDPSAVIALIESSIAPESWGPGPASLAEYAEQKSVVISQTKENHIQVIELLNSLRKPASK